ncbi:hypothetical protein QL285_042041 [Trifolium repens]|nr:hypothetical protein QL285_042041 [Trifolium repens]
MGLQVLDEVLGKKVEDRQVEIEVDDSQVQAPPVEDQVQAPPVVDPQVEVEDPQVQAPPVEDLQVQAPPIEAPQAQRKVNDLMPDMANLDITVKVMDVKVQHRSPRVVDSLVGDETGMILLRTTGKEQAKRVRRRRWSTIRLRNARTDLFNNNMRLKVESATDIEDAPAAQFYVKVENNVSLHRYTLLQ